jgi:hypothetical protein
MPTRQEVVLQLMTRANTALEHACTEYDASGAEVLSAYLTMALSVVRAARAAGADMRPLRAGVQSILLDCANDTVM